MCFCETEIRDSKKGQRLRQKQNEGGRAWAIAKENGRLHEKSEEEKVGKEADGEKKKKRARGRGRESERDCTGERAREQGQERVI